MTKIEGIAFDFTGVIGSEKNVHLDKIDTILEKEFGNFPSDQKYFEWATKKTNLSQEEIHLRTEKIINNLYYLKEPDLFNRLPTTRTALASNHLSYLRTWLESIDHLKNFNTIYISAEVFKQKPNQDYFLGLSEAMDLDPSKILFIDDNQINVDGARSVGVNAYLYKNDQKLSDFVLSLI